MSILEALENRDGIPLGMDTFGKKIYGFAELLKHHKITIQEPDGID